MSAAADVAQEKAIERIPTSSPPPESMDAPTLPHIAERETTEFKKGRDFWLSFIAILVSIFLSALDLAAVGTALPTIASALHDTKGDFTWVGSAYALASTAIMPLSGSLADVFGRKPVMLISIGFFSLGSALAGAAQNMNMMIAARTIQGLGGGGIINLTEILTSDLVPLSERGLYQGLLGLTWSFASGMAAPVGGALASKGKKAWRWLFFLNLPLTGMAFFLVLIYLNVNKPEGSMSSKLKRVDWTGNAIVVAAITLANVGLTFGGIRFPWTSAQVLAPLIIGILLLGVFAWYEVKIAQEPAVPSDILTNRTTVSGILSTAAHGITSISIIYYLPVYFQACFGASPIHSAVDFLPTTFIIAPFALSSGIVVILTGKYRPVNWFGWAITIVGFGLFSMFKATTPTGKWVGYQIITGAGTGLIFSSPIFPILAPLPVTRTAAALALFSFTRAFTQTWGITIGSTILQNQLKKNLPAAFLSQFPTGLEIAYAAIPQINSLPEPLRTEVRAGFASSMKAIWQTMIGISGLGLLVSLLMAEVKMKNVVDTNYALKGDEPKNNGADVDA